MSEVRQAYLQGFEGGDLKPERARLVEAFVNGVDGVAVDNLRLCEIGGFKRKDGDSARGLIWKMFTSPAHEETYRAEREYVRFLQAQNLMRSTWGADEIRERLQKNVMLAQGEIAFPKLLVANYKGAIVTKVVNVAEINIQAATQALHLLGKQQGMFVDRVKISEDDFDAMTDEELASELEKVRGDTVGESGGD